MLYRRRRTRPTDRPTASVVDSLFLYSKRRISQPLLSCLRFFATTTTPNPAIISGIVDITCSSSSSSSFCSSQRATTTHRNCRRHLTARPRIINTTNVSRIRRQCRHLRTSATVTPYCRRAGGISWAPERPVQYSRTAGINRRAGALTSYRRHPVVLSSDRHSRGLCEVFATLGRSLTPPQLAGTTTWTTMLHQTAVVSQRARRRAVTTQPASPGCRHRTRRRRYLDTRRSTSSRRVRRRASAAVRRRPSPPTRRRRRRRRHLVVATAPRTRSFRSSSERSCRHPTSVCRWPRSAATSSGTASTTRRRRRRRRRRATRRRRAGGATSDTRCRTTSSSSSAVACRPVAATTGPSTRSVVRRSLPTISASNVRGTPYSCTRRARTPRRRHLSDTYTDRCSPNA